MLCIFTLLAMFNIKTIFRPKVVVLNLVFFGVYLTCVAQEATAQGPGQHKLKIIRKLQRVVWTAGLSGVVIDDDGQPLKNLFNAKKSWNLLPFPTRITAEGLITKGISAEIAFTYTRYKKGKTVNNDINSPGGSFVAIDANAKYDLNEVIGDTKAFNPYIIGGLGYTSRSALAKGQQSPTANIGLGFNVWVYKGFGIHVQSMAKFKLVSQSSNYLMHSAGIVYRFNLLTGSRLPGRHEHRYTLFKGL